MLGTVLARVIGYTCYIFLSRFRVYIPSVYLSVTGCTFVLFTKRNSYMSFLMVPKSVTLNDLGRRSELLSSINPVLLH